MRDGVYERRKRMSCKEGEPRGGKQNEGREQRDRYIASEMIAGISAKEQWPVLT